MYTSSSSSSSSSSSAAAAAMAERRDGKDDDQQQKPRRYQLDVLETAKNTNTIVYLETGCGKTLIAVLLLQAFRNLLRQPQKGVFVFLVPTRNLVFQQGDVIKSKTDLKVGLYSGTSGSDMWNNRRWEYEIEKHEVFVMTPQILLNNLYHSFMKMEMIKLLIFDECHHCQKEHPYACIMKEFYHEMDIQKRPRIFGMTASPVIGKGGYSEHKYGNVIQMLESTLDSKIYTIRDREELDSVLATPDLIKEEYDSIDYGNKKLISCIHVINDLVIKHSRFEGHAESYGGEMMDNLLEKRKNFMAKIQRSLQYCVYELGVWCSKYAAELLLQGDLEPEGSTGYDKSSFLQKVIACLCSFFPEGGIDDSIDVLDQPLMSNKVAALVEVLSVYWEDDTQCIVFVERTIAARVLAGILGRFQCLRFLRSKFLIGSQGSSKAMSKKEMQQVLEEFRSGKVNLLVATNVAEEGLDIQSCSLIIRFDLPKTVRSFIQSRGRARKLGSKYIVLLESDSKEQEELLNNLMMSELLMQEKVKENFYLPMESEIVKQPAHEKLKVESTGATIPLNHSIALLNHFCSSLPRDEFFKPTPKFSVISGGEGFRCEVTLPVNAPIRRVVGLPCSSIHLSKKAACLEACKLLYEVGALTDYLLPWKTQKNTMEDYLSPENSYEQSALDSKTELYEAVTPNILRRQTDTFNSISVYAYSLRFFPCPCDRDYAYFALFLESPIPDDATSLDVELQLGNGRTVISQLVPSGKLVLNVSQVTEAENFQIVLFTMIIEQQIVHPDYNGTNVLPFNGFSDDRRWYLLLPTVQKNDKICNELEVDWQTIKSVLHSSLSLPHSTLLKEGIFSKNSSILHMADSKIPSQDVAGAVVRTTHNNKLYCIVDVLYDMCARSKFPQPPFSNYYDFFRSKHNIFLVHPNQPMLKAKWLKVANNFLTNRTHEVHGNGCSRSKEEILVELPPEVCHIELRGISTSIANSATLLPSFMHRLESILVASQLRDAFSTGFMQGSHVSLYRILEALTTADSLEKFSLERLELLGDSFLKFSVSCDLFLKHDKQDEGFLSERRKWAICNLALYKHGIKHNIPGYIRSSFFVPTEWVAPGHPCKITCDIENLMQIHGSDKETRNKNRNTIVCNKGHRWIKRKTVADSVEALIGAYLVDGGQDSALAFMKWIGLNVDFEPSLVYSIGNKALSYPALFKRYHLRDVEELLGYKFSYDGLLLEAFTHASFGYTSSCYQRLEFLGDAVLDYLITRYLYTMFDKLTPGQLTDVRCAIVSNERFARVAVQHHLEQYLLEDSITLQRKIKNFVHSVVNVANGDIRMADQLDAEMCPKVLADILESLAGALFVDTGFDVDKFWNVFEPLLHPIVSVESLQLNPIRELSELCQKHQLSLDFDSTKVYNGYLMEAKIITADAVVSGNAKAEHKISARRRAAHDALQKLKLMGLQHSRRSIIDYFKALNGKFGNSAPSRNVDSRSAKEKVAFNHDKSPAENTKHIISSSSTSTSCIASVKEVDNGDRCMSSLLCNQNKENTTLIPVEDSFDKLNVKCKAPAPCPNSLDMIPSCAEEVKNGERCMSTLLYNQKEEKTMLIHAKNTLGMSNLVCTAPASYPSSLVNTPSAVTKFSKRNYKGESDLEPLNSAGKHEDFEEKVLSANSESVLVLTQNLKTQLSSLSSVQHSSLNPEDYTTPKSTITFAQGQPRAEVHEICSKNKWADPSYICVKEEGLPHNKLFTYTVALALPGIGTVHIQGHPMKTTKLAMDTAAAESLSLLKRLHYI